jgi:hypothetical protein
MKHFTLAGQTHFQSVNQVKIKGNEGNICVKTKFLSPLTAENVCTSLEMIDIPNIFKYTFVHHEGKTYPTVTSCFHSLCWQKCSTVHIDVLYVQWCGLILSPMFIGWITNKNDWIGTSFDNVSASEAIDGLYGFSNGFVSSNENAFNWLQIDLKYKKLVVEIEIHRMTSEYSLEGVEVRVGNTTIPHQLSLFTDNTLCGSSPTSSDIGPCFVYRPTNPVYGQYIVIQKKVPGYLGIEEIEVKTKNLRSPGI